MTTTHPRFASVLPLRAALASGLLVTAALLGACASAPEPRSQMAVAEAAVQAANTPSTSEYAPAELQLAVDKLAQAHKAMRDRDYLLARNLAEQTQVDAQAAEQKAQAVRSRRAAQASADADRALREELARKNGS